ncbi:hypothetical protein PYCCODRAFT_713636 [Trametes coccinea BRFM310]|uniref:Uncharacterized protein n=1 Tax=Trametes coccinea (strain BRFM310) TaxID=1353009 RepID=A0A1Y2IHI6_TRAC3|nr:hypothetical protein PYCCODRAFT_713636 [Trametes coccinea BRFM310]
MMNDSEPLPVPPRMRAASSANRNIGGSTSGGSVTLNSLNEQIGLLWKQNALLVKRIEALEQIQSTHLDVGSTRSPSRRSSIPPGATIASAWRTDVPKRSGGCLIRADTFGVGTASSTAQASPAGSAELTPHLTADCSNGLFGPPTPRPESSTLPEPTGDLSTRDSLLVTFAQADDSANILFDEPEPLINVAPSAVDENAV